MFYCYILIVNGYWTFSRFLCLFHASLGIAQSCCYMLNLSPSLSLSFPLSLALSLPWYVPLELFFATTSDILVLRATECLNLYSILYPLTTLCQILLNELNDLLFYSFLEWLAEESSCHAPSIMDGLFLFLATVITHQEVGSSVFQTNLLWMISTKVQDAPPLWFHYNPQYKLSYLLMTLVGEVINTCII